MNVHLERDILQVSDCPFIPDFHFAFQVSNLINSILDWKFKIQEFNLTFFVSFTFLGQAKPIFCDGIPTERTFK